MMHELLSQVAGVTKSLELLNITIIAVRANSEGAQIKIDQPLPPELESYVEEHGDAGHNLWGVWITWPTN